MKRRVLPAPVAAAKAKSDFGNDPEHSFRADKKSDQIKSRFVFVHATAGSQHIAIREHNLEADHIIARHAVLQTARAAGIRRDVSPNAAIFHACRIGRIK